MKLPETIANVHITRQSWLQGKIEGEVTAAQYQWQFQWLFREGKLLIKPSLGRSLIQEPLCRFFERYDYQLEVGSDYQFIIRGHF